MDALLIFAIDFDGVIVEERYPAIGPLLPGAKETILWLYGEGHWIIINSCRTGMEEQEMVEFLRDQGIPFHTANQNLPHRIEMYGNDCRKIGADVYIDDRSVFSEGIDWMDIRSRLERRLGVERCGERDGRPCVSAR